MKYYVILIVTYNNGSKDKVGIYSYDNETAAIKGFFNYMASYIGGDGVATVNVVAKNNVGGKYKEDTWIAPVEPEPSEETETE